MTERIRHLLDQIYPVTQSEATYQRLMDRLAHYDHLLQPNRDGSPPLTQRDIVLITYADTLQQHTAPPLQTLHQFSAQHIKGLISAIHLLPFYPSSSDDGFSVMDYYAVDPDFGDWKHIDALRQDFDLMFDAVINHMSAKSEWFGRFLAGDLGYTQAFFTAHPTDDLSAVVRPRTSPLLTQFTTLSGETVYAWTTFSADQVDLNYQDPDTLLRVLDVLLFYIEHGARLLRLDAIAFLWKAINSPSIHLPQTHAIIQLVRAVLDVVAPDVILITETNVPHQENISYFGDGHNEAQMVYNFTLPPLLFYSLLTGDTTHLQKWINTLQTPSDKTTFFNFTASHDGIGLRPVEGILSPHDIDQMAKHVESRGGRISYRNQPDGSQSPYEFNITYVDAMAIPGEGDDQHIQCFLLSQAVMLALAGVPAIYIHSLLGSRNDGANVARTGHPRSINRSKLNADTISAALNNPTAFRAKIFNAYRHLLHVRAQHAAFAPTSPQHALVTNNRSILALKRNTANQSVLCLFNLSGQSQSIVLTTGGHDLLSDQHFAAGELTLEPYQYVWLASATL